MQLIGRAFLLLILLLAVGTAQVFTSLNGAVTDRTGGVVGGAIVELINLDTTATRKYVTDNSGLFVAGQLPPGNYSVTVKALGFSIYKVPSLSLAVNTPTTLDVKIEIGSTTETVSVNAEVTPINSVDASLGAAVNTQAITELPFEARNPARLLALQPGVTYFGEGSMYGRPTTGTISTQDRLNGSVHGSKPDQNNITLDGVDVNDQNTRNAFQSVLRVTLDSVQEFRTTTQNPTAEQGRGSGAQIALVTKGGSNSLHGSLYEYNRNTISSANNFFNNISGVVRPKLIRNTFGASVGGPIKKNRLFYFLNYEGRRDASATPVTRVVPTAGLRAGNILYINSAGGVSTMTPAQLKAADPLGIGPNSHILDLLKSYPLPNDATLGDGFNTAGYRFSASTPLRFNTYISRLDYVLDPSNKNTVFWRGNLQNDNIQGVPQFPGQAAATVDLDNSKGYAAGWTSVVKPNFISTFHYGYTRSGHETNGTLNAAYISLRNIATPQATTATLARIIPAHQFSEDLSWIKGRHEVRFGGGVLLISNRSTNYGSAYPFGSVSYGSLAAAGNDLKPADLAGSFSSAFKTVAVDLLGPVAAVTVTYNYTLDGKVLPFGQPVQRNFVANEYEAYVNDNWKATSNLTLNLGLRYMLAPAIHEADGRCPPTSI
jgi:hypothetical protein